MRLPSILCFLLIGIGSLFHKNAYTQGIAIGAWREHLNYQNTLQLLKSDKLYATTPQAIFSIDETNSITRYNKVTGLSDVYISCIAWDSIGQQLFVGYQNGNIDLVKGDQTINIPDVLQSSFIGSKRYYQCFIQNDLAYLSSGLGIIVANLRKREIKETWIIGNNGNQVTVFSLSLFNNQFFAATSEGLKVASTNNAALTDYRNWRNLSGTNGLSDGMIRNVGVSYGSLIIQKNDSLLINRNTNWIPFYTDNNWRITEANFFPNSIHLSQKDNNGNARVIILNASGNIIRTISQSGIISDPRASLLDGNTVWVADFFGGLSKHSNIIERFIPNGPPATASGEFAFSKDTLYTAAGSVNIAWNYLFNRNGVYNFASDTWNAKNNFNTPLFDSVFDFITVATDPGDQTIWAGSYGGGLVNFANAGPILYKQRNSNLQAAIGDPNSYRIAGLAFDRDQQLWISNYGAPQPLKLRKKDGSWLSFNIPFSLTENAVAQIVTDEFNQVWIMSPKSNGLICYNYGNSIDNTNDDRWKLFRQGSGSGNLPSSTILSIAKDRNSTIWVGTDDGIAWIRCTSDVFGGSACEAEIPVVKQGAFNGFLLKGEQVQTIAVDGANRKWVGTKNGTWLLSEDGGQILAHFTSANSKLLHNNILKVGIHPTTGEVFFATEIGICSFRSTATEPNAQISNVVVYPNPVPASFNGTIGIRGLTENSIVKITELNGRLVYQTRSTGGQAVWNSRDFNGNKVAAGVYLVLIRDETGAKKMVSKIFILSGR
jgi:hypothetical protein